MKARIFAGIVALATLAAALAGCSPEERYAEAGDGDLYGEAGDRAPVYTEGTPDDTFARIDKQANGG